MDTNDKKVILITGATKGLGLADAIRLSKDSKNIVIANSHRELSDAERDELQSKFANPVDILVGDVASEDDAKSMVNEVVDKYGRIDVLINNAGITQDTLLTRMKADSFKQVLDTNLFGVFNMTKFALKNMQKKRQGCIINMASIAGLHGNLGQANYSASKAGIVGLTKTIAQEGALRGIRCNAVAPGMITSDMTAKLSDKNIKKWEEQIPLGRFGNPDEVAEVVEFLINSRYITGQVITVDGGLTM
ncbi:3-oxoacyl-ACP reductase FabG [Apilactobacillus xinyiensis]|uniref:3-oxoacyl-ACP reductase FabG n=1 Tax=Apilactobacillus xinyiensis TaxID=2841032 RepID=UPI00200D65FE|nr:3-oxoacyl-ACP reductase FabG [Apilactobacillus xinyiensis]MCL0318645.1 3-oxoacyl-ACP reductase FabG [Apilactobacillus xinyiensis]